MQQVLLQFSENHSDFRLAELKALAELENVEIEYDQESFKQSQFVFLRVSSEDAAKKLVQRCILVKQVIVPWATASNLQELVEKVRERRDLIEKVVDETWRFNIYSNLKVSQAEKLDIFNMFSFINFSKKAQMKDAKNEFWIILKDSEYYFGTFLASGSRHLINEYSLKKREFLGTTTMDPELSLIMANMALARAGSFILDPFAGTGSFLIACSHHKAFTVGTDIDAKQLRGRIAVNCKPSNIDGYPIKTKGEKRDYQLIKENDYKCVSDNIKQYNLQGLVLDTLICDLKHHPWRLSEYWDAIVCDPPYGIRAGAKKLTKGTMEKHRWCREFYDFDEILLDLIDFAARYLVVSGRLVFWLPTINADYSENDIPKHPSLQLLANSEQNFGKWSRRLITMQKYQTFTQDWSVDRDFEPGHAGFRQKYFNK